VKKSFYILLTIFIVAAAVVGVSLWKKQSEQVTGDPRDNEEVHKLNNEIDSLVIQHHQGNVLVKEWDQPEVKISKTVKETDAETPNLTIVQKGNKIVFETEEYEGKVDVTLWIPIQISSVDVALTRGNIKGEGLAAKKFVRFVTQIGNIVATYQSLDPHSKNILITKTGTILAQVPQGTEVKLPTGKGILNGVEESKSGVEFNVMASLGSTTFQSEDFKIEALMGDTLLTPEQMKKDADFIIDKLMLKHPFFVGAADEQTNEKIEVIYDGIQQPLTAEQFYLLLHSVFAYTKDGHTTLRSYSKDYISFPPVIWAKEGIIVTEKTDEFEKGDRILAIHGKSENQVLELLREVVPAEHDGYVKMNTKNFLTPGMFLRKLGLVNQDNRVPILIERNGEELKVALALNPSTTNEDDFGDRLFESVVHPPYRGEIHPNHNWGVITLNASIYNEEYHSFVVSFLDDLESKGIKNLVIDNRQNTGGTSLVADPFLKELKKRSLTKEHVFLLTSTNTFSAGTDIAVELKSQNLATIVGTETGNIIGYLGNVEPFSLPVTQWGGGIPTTRNGVTGGFDPSKPLQPDYYIEVTREDIMNGVDPWFEKIKELVK
jgi:hypothetical protein